MAQGLADLLSGAAGAPINRPALNAFVANSQAKNGLVSAQTQDALIKAQQAQEEMDAHSRIATSMMEANPDMRQSEANLARDLLVGHFGGDSVTALKALGTLKLGYGSPAEQTQGQQMVQGKIAGPIATPPNFQMPVAPPQGSALSPVQQSPQGAAQTADTQSQADLREVQAKAGGFNPHTGGGAGGPIDPNEAAYGAYTLYKTGKMLPLGMGNAAMRNAFISGAAQLSQQESQGQTVANPGFDAAIANGQDYLGAQRALNSYAGGPLGGQVRAVNNVVGHLQLMEQLFTGLQNGDVQVVNKLGNQWNKAFGSPAPTNIQTAASFIGPEMIKILSNNNSTGTAPERQEFSNTAANLANAPEQTGQAISTLKNMLGRQMTDMALQYHGATGRSDFARRYVAPDVANYLEIAPDGGTGPQGPGAPAAPTDATTSASPARGAATVLPPQALGQLKEGFHTTFGNGQMWTLQNGKPVRVQ